MFIINITYKKPLTEIDVFLAAHRIFLDTGYQQNYFLASGPQNPRIGGIIISQLKDRDQLEKFILQDPFRIHDLADYKIIEFNPVKYHADLTKFIENST